MLKFISFIKHAFNKHTYFACLLFMLAVLIRAIGLLYYRYIICIICVFIYIFLKFILLNTVSKIIFFYENCTLCYYYLTHICLSFYVNYNIKFKISNRYKSLDSSIDYNLLINDYDFIIFVLIALTLLLIRLYLTFLFMKCSYPSLNFKKRVSYINIGNLGYTHKRLCRFCFLYLILFIILLYLCISDRDDFINYISDTNDFIYYIPDSNNFIYYMSDSILSFIRFIVSNYLLCIEFLKNNFLSLISRIEIYYQVFIILLNDAYVSINLLINIVLNYILYFHNIYPIVQDISDNIYNAINSVRNYVHAIDNTNTITTISQSQYISNGKTILQINKPIGFSVFVNERTTVPTSFITDRNFVTHLFWFNIYHIKDNRGNVIKYIIRLRANPYGDPNDTNPSVLVNEFTTVREFFYNHLFNKSSNPFIKTFLNPPLNMYKMFSREFFLLLPDKIKTEIKTLYRRPRNIFMSNVFNYKAYLNMIAYTVQDMLKACGSVSLSKSYMEAVDNPNAGDKFSVCSIYDIAHCVDSRLHDRKPIRDLKDFVSHKGLASDCAHCRYFVQSRTRYYDQMRSEIGSRRYNNFIKKRLKTEGEVLINFKPCYLFMDSPNLTGYTWNGFHMMTIEYYNIKSMLYSRYSENLSIKLIFNTEGNLSYTGLRMNSVEDSDYKFYVEPTGRQSFKEFIKKWI